MSATSIDLNTRLSLKRREVALVTGLSEKTIERATNAGDLRAKRTRVGSGDFVYLIDDVREWLRSLPEG